MLMVCGRAMIVGIIRDIHLRMAYRCNNSKHIYFWVKKEVDDSND